MNSKKLLREESLNKSSSSSLALCILVGDALIPTLAGPCVAVIVSSPLLAASRFKADVADTDGLLKGDNDCALLLCCLSEV